MKRIISVLAIPAGLIATVIATTTMNDTLGFVRTGTLFLVIATIFSIACMLLKDEVFGGIFASVGVTLAVVIEFLTFARFNLQGLENSEAWGTCGPFLGYISNDPVDQMGAECIFIFVGVALISLMIWVGYGLWEDHTRSFRMA